MKEWQLKIQAVYLNSKQHMKNIPEDWEKVFESFNKILKDYNNDPLVNDEIQKAIIQLEEYLREVMLNYALRKLQRERRKFEEFLETIDDSEMRLILRLRCINNMGWSDIGEELNMDRRTASRKFYKFFREQKLPTMPVDM